MEDVERIINAKNRVFQANISFGKDNPISMNTDDKHIYRVTGTSQIEDIINSGYVRPPFGKAKGGHIGEVFWTQGSDKLYFYDKRPVLETSTDILKENGQIGAISLDNLTGVWMYDEQQNKYVNNIQAVRNAYNQMHPVQEQIIQLKEQISAYNKQITTLLSNLQPYMQIPKVNREISKVIEKNNEINSSQIIDSLNDYKNVVEIKQSLLTYLEQADKFIKDNVGKSQQPIAQQQTQVQADMSTQSLPTDFWKEFEQPEQELKPQQPLPNNFWDEFDNPNNGRNVGPERKYNDDGTYTMEYIAHLATTPLGFNKNIYNQLNQENEAKRQQDEGQMTSGRRHM